MPTKNNVMRNNTLSQYLIADTLILRSSISMSISITDLHYIMQLLEVLN